MVPLVPGELEVIVVQVLLTCTDFRSRLGTLAGVLFRRSQVVPTTLSQPLPRKHCTCSSQTITFSIYTYMRRYIKTQNYIESYTAGSMATEDSYL